MGATADDYSTAPVDPNPPNVVTCPLLKIDFIQNKNGIEGLALISRTYDGTNNNKNIPDWGSTNSYL